MSGDSRGFVRKLFQGQGTALVRYLTSRVRSSSDAQDIAQEAYVRLLRVDRVDLIRDPQAYLFRVAANLAREHQLKQARTPMDVRDAEDLLAIDALDRQIEDVVDLQARVAEMNRVLAGLEPRHRAVLLLHRRDGMTYEEIARELGISFHTVKKYLSIALAACREALPAPDLESSP
jgi:RNA polymerase sigma-19 factor, ECF subfamily